MLARMATPTTTASTCGVAAQSACCAILGTGIYVGDAALRNRLRATEAHSTLAVDGREITPFDAGDLFFMPPSARGRRVEWSAE